MLENDMPKAKKGDKADKIVSAALTVLSRNGYENTTINDVASAAGVSRGLLHYYFKDKEDMVAKALTFGFGSMWESSMGSLQKARSADELVNGMIEVLKKNVQENPDFSALLFEMWVSSRRSEKIRKVFSDGLEETIRRLKELMQVASSVGILKIKDSEAEGIVRMLIALYHGLTIQLLTNPEKIKENKIWIPIRNALLSMFDGKS
jgi:AcrR family transcriptional regulator